MKRAIHLALCLLLFAPVFASSGIKIPTAAASTRKVSNPYYAFAYVAVPQGNNVYSVTIYFILADSVHFTKTYVNTPQSVSITGNFGVGVTSFTFPAGVNSLNVGNFTFSSPPTQAISITTDPTSIGGVSISGWLTDLEIP
jgi:hypothetical protein